MKFIEKHPAIWRYISVFAILSLIIPALFVTRYAGTTGKYIGYTIYLFIAMASVYEVIRNLGLHKITTFIIPLAIIVYFVYPLTGMDKNMIDVIDSSTIKHLVHQSLSWKSILIAAAIATLVGLDPKLSNDKKKLGIAVIISVVTVTFIGLFAKFLWIVNMKSVEIAITLISIAIISDSFAYFGGKYLGKYILHGKKLAPRLSPKKTWAGFIVSYIVTAAYISTTSWFIHIYGDFSFTTEITLIVCLSVALPIISPLGDLLFSGIKRYLGIKDFSNLMPGHGGLMDRLDAMCVVMTVISLVFIFG